MMSQNPKFLNAVTNAKLFHFHHLVFWKFFLLVWLLWKFTLYKHKFSNRINHQNLSNLPPAYPQHSHPAPESTESPPFTSVVACKIFKQQQPNSSVHFTSSDTTKFWMGGHKSTLRAVRQYISRK